MGSRVSAPSGREGGGATHEAQVSMLRKTAPKLEVRATKRFNRDYKHASSTMRVAARQKVREMQIQARVSTTWMKAYKSVSGLKRSIPGQVIELRIGGGDRLLAHVRDGTATLVALGHHAVADEIVMQRDLKAELEQAGEPPEGFAPANLLDLIMSDIELRRGDPDLSIDTRLFGPEVQSEWLQALSDEQVAAWTQVTEIVDDLLDDDDEGALYKVVFIEGGARDGEDQRPPQSARPLHARGA